MNSNREVSFEFSGQEAKPLEFGDSTIVNFSLATLVNHNELKGKIVKIFVKSTKLDSEQKGDTGEIIENEVGSFKDTDTITFDYSYTQEQDPKFRTDCSEAKVRLIGDFIGNNDESEENEEENDDAESSEYQNQYEDE